ncbi:MAG: bifunctional oligoribonuclease/PAP phosphatase NrnA [Caldilineae bacterium]|nr:MAG: bifunctional oligoribonuclease/PAP phosphatase NrnA [Caldilineae bacterium]
MSTEALVPPQELLDAIMRARHPLVIAHVAPDGDAIGSVLACGRLLHHLGKDPILACQDRVPAAFRFLPGHDRLRTEIEGFEIDMVISLDSSDPSRMGRIYESRFNNIPLAVVDHHITNVYFGNVNWVEPEACATAEMIYYLARAFDIEPDQEMATCILTGIVTDTRGFRTANTTARVMNLASRLMEAGAPLGAITEQALNSRSLDLVRLWGRALDTVAVEDGVVSAENSLRMRADLDGVIRAEGLVSFILGVYEAKAAVVFTELAENEVECSFRARPGYDVSQVAFEFGGGGHPLASGCTLAGTLPEVKEEVLRRLKEAVNHSNRER